MLGVFNQPAITALEQTTSFTQRRHELLAGNIANLDTPGYQSRDLSPENFQQALAEAIEASRSPSPGSSMSDSSRVEAMEGPRKAMEDLLFHDGSKVNLERQVTEIAKNQSLHNTAIALMRSQFSVLRVAISERV